MDDRTVYYIGFAGSFLIHALVCLHIYLHFSSLWQFSETIYVDVDLSMFNGDGSGSGAAQFADYRDELSADAPAPIRQPEPEPLDVPEVALAPVAVQTPRPAATPQKEKVLTPVPASPETSRAEGVPESAGPAGGAGGQAGRGSGFGGTGGGVSPARPVYAPNPVYPWAARSAGFQGSVQLEVLVNEQGEVKEIAVLRGSGRGDCDESAVKTVRERWEFAPAMVNGAPVAMRQKIIVRYMLR